MAAYEMSMQQRYRVQEILRDNCLEFGARLPNEVEARARVADLVMKAERNVLSLAEKQLLSDLALSLLKGL